MRIPDLDLGHGVTAVWISHGDHDRAGIIEYHQCAGGNCRDPQTGGPGRCGGGVLFDLPGIAELFPGRELWQVEQWDPLTLSPSLQCGCNGCTHHGYIQNGQWEPA